MKMLLESAGIKSKIYAKYSKEAVIFF